jgi:subtilisin family serine protease
MGPLDLVNLSPLMARTIGRAEIKIALIDGPVALDHPDLAAQNIHQVPGKLFSACSKAGSLACLHGTFVAGMLMANRGSAAPAICPGCTLLVCPIFSEMTPVNGNLPSAKPEELASAIVDSANAGARVINLSAAVSLPSVSGERQLVEALNYAARRNVLVVVAAGNQGTVGSSVLTRHPWSIPVAACDSDGRTMPLSNLGGSIGRHGLLAPGGDITSLASSGEPRTFGGTSAAVPFVVGTIALLWSEFPSSTAPQIKLAITQASSTRRIAITPPLLNAWSAFEAISNRRS